MTELKIILYTQDKCDSIHSSTAVRNFSSQEKIPDAQGHLVSDLNHRCLVNQAHDVVLGKKEGPWRRGEKKEKRKRRKKKKKSNNKYTENKSKKETKSHDNI